MLAFSHKEIRTTDIGCEVVVLVVQRIKDTRQRTDTTRQPTHNQCRLRLKALVLLGIQGMTTRQPAFAEVRIKN
jgi:hypothetical protein